MAAQYAVYSQLFRVSLALASRLGHVRGGFTSKIQAVGPRASPKGSGHRAVDRTLDRSILLGKWLACARNPIRCEALQERVCGLQIGCLEALRELVVNLS